MSESVRLGAADVPARVIGLDRYQLAFLVLGAGGLADSLVRSRNAVEAAGALVMLVAALPAGERVSAGERIALAVAYLSRSHVSSVALERGDEVTVHATSSVATRGYALRHRGRLDLSGVDLELARSLAGTLDALATSPTGRHVSLHVRRDGDGVATLLCLGGGRAPEGWRRDDDLLARVAGVELADHLWLLERLTYVRTAHEVCRVLRVRDFSAATVPLLAGLQRGRDEATLALHVDVLDDVRARRRAERLSHAATSNEAAAGALGFRESSAARRRVARTLQRETRVAEGRALVRLAVFVTVRATRLEDLADAVEGAVHAARESGLVLERGAGRQARWFAQALPGGPGW